MNMKELKTETNKIDHTKMNERYDALVTANQERQYEPLTMDKKEFCKGIALFIVVLVPIFLLFCQ